MIQASTGNMIPYTMSAEKTLQFLNRTEPPQKVASVVVNAFENLTLDRDEMIHIAVPDTQTLVEKTDAASKYTAFNIHVNGWFHAAVRYSHLLKFADNIRNKFGTQYRGPDFPSKQLFALDEKALEKRRQGIAKYLNAMVQTSAIVRSPFVERRFLEFQIDSYRATSSHVTIDVYLGDGEKITIRCDVGTPTNSVLKILCEQINCSSVDDFLWNFGLFMARSHQHSNSNFDMLCVRLLRNFEAPYISLHSINQRSAAHGVYHKLIVRKLVWDPKVEESLLGNVSFADLLFRQARQDLMNGRISGPNECIDKLKSLEKRNDRLQFLRQCQQQSSYSYELLGSCTTDYLSAGSERKCQVRIGRRQLVLDFGGQGDKRYFRATRIRVWRVSQPLDTTTPSTNGLSECQLLFQFEYLVAKDKFEWITLQTDQAILLSLLLQSVGSEILHEHHNVSIEDQLQSKGRPEVSKYFENSQTTDDRKFDLPRSSHTIEYNQYVPIFLQAMRKRDPALGKPSLLAVERTNSWDKRSQTSEKSNGDKRGEEPPRTDPLGVANYDDIFTTITDVLPLHNAAFSNITDDDL